MKKVFYLSGVFFIFVYAQNPIIKAMKEEIKRCTKKLKIENEPPPYFISYMLVERKGVSISASMGALISVDSFSKRYIAVDVRIGDYQFDSSPDFGEETGYFNETEGSEYMNVPVPLENAVDVLRHTLWQLTEKRYKRAIKRFAEKKGRRAREVKKRDVPDFSREPKVSYIGEIKTPQVNISKWKEKLRRYSRLFKKYPWIIKSSVSFSCTAVNKYFVNSEGSTVVYGNLYYYLRIFASTKAEDGNWVKNLESFFGWSEDELPSDSIVIKKIEKLIDELLQLKEAEALEAYSGPALILSPASGVFMHEVLGHRVEAQRVESRGAGETFKDKLGKKVISPIFTVYDDPTLRYYKGQPLNGYYPYDDEGVKARRVDIIKNGVLVNFLMSRKPIKGFLHSNGHGRAQMENAFWGNDTPYPRQGNFIVETSEPKKIGELKKMLIEEARKKKKPFGLIFVKSWGGATYTGRWLMEAFQSQPIIVYKIDAETGEEKMVRGIKFGGTPLMSLDKVIAAGDDPKVFNGFCGAESGSIPVALVAPSILLSEIEVTKTPETREKPPILPPPGGEK